MSKNKQNNQHVHQQFCRDVLSKTATTVTAAHTEAELQQERSELGQFSMNEKLHENQTEVLQTKPTASFKSSSFIRDAFSTFLYFFQFVYLDFLLLFIQPFWA